ncbi:MAG: hypothetical protein LCH73_02975 [Proteobacteria bacterium]|nr:hypothetical protein [Pseudomonadota bacterium]
MPTFNFAGLATTDNYSTGIVPKINGADASAAMLLDPTYVTYAGAVAIGAKRITSGGVLEQFNGSSWVELPTGYAKRALGQFGAGVQTNPDAAVLQASGTLEVCATAAQLLRAQHEVDGGSYYIGLNQYQSGGWQVYDPARAPAQIVMTSSNGASTIRFRTKAANGGNALERMVLDENGALTLGGQTVWHAGNLNPAALAPLASPAFTGNPIAPTPAVGDNDTSVATTAFVQQAVGTRLPLSGGTVAGMVTVEGVAEGVRLKNSQAYISGFDSAGAVRTGYLQFNSGSDVRLGVDTAAPIKLIVDNVTRLIVSTAQMEVTRGARSVPKVAPYSAAITLDARDSNTFLVGTLTGNVTNLTVINATEGQFLTIRFTQDGTGNRTVALGSSAVSGSPALGAGKVSYLNITLNAAASRFEGAWMAIP